MAIHISARVAWHDSGWNGRVCQHPKANTYCVGQYSFPVTPFKEWQLPPYSIGTWPYEEMYKNEK